MTIMRMTLSVELDDNQGARVWTDEQLKMYVNELVVDGVESLEVRKYREFARQYGEDPVIDWGIIVKVE